MGDYSSVATSIKFEPGSVTCSNNINGTSNDFGIAGFSANSISQNLCMTDEINTSHLENTSGTLIHDSENHNESEGKYIYQQHIHNKHKVSVDIYFVGVLW